MREKLPEWSNDTTSLFPWFYSLGLRVGERHLWQRGSWWGEVWPCGCMDCDSVGHCRSPRTAASHVRPWSKSSRRGESTPTPPLLTMWRLLYRLALSLHPPRYVPPPNSIGLQFTEFMPCESSQSLRSHVIAHFVTHPLLCLVHETFMLVNT